MKITKRLTSIILCLTLLFTQGIVLAANPGNITVSCNNIGRIITISGTVTTTRQNENIVFTVLKKDVAEEAYRNASFDEIGSVLNNIYQQKLNADGSFSFTFKMVGESGNYLMLIDSKALSSTYKDTIVFNNTLWNELNTLKDDTSDGALERFRSFIEAEALPLGIDLTEYNSLSNKDSACTALKSYAGDYTAETFVSEWENNITWSFIDENRNNIPAISLVVANKNAMDNSFFNQSWMSYMLDNFSDAVKSELYSKVLSDTDCDSLEKFVQMIKDNLVVAYVHGTTYWKDLYDMIEAENNILEFNSSSLATFNSLSNKDIVVNALHTQGQSKNTSAEIISLFDTLVAAQKTEESRPVATSTPKPSGNGGGGGLSMSIPVLPTPTATPTPTEPSEPVKPEASEPPAPVFNDIESVEWAKESIEYLADKEILSGVGDGRFEPNRYMTREELIKMLDNAFGYSKDAAECDFADADKDAWYYAAVAGAVNKGIINGYEDNTFGIGEYITRQDTAVILLRAAGIDSFTKNEAVEFTDNEDISDYAKEAVEFLSGSGIISGMGNGTFAPKGNLTRAQAAKLFYGLLMHIEA